MVNDNETPTGKAVSDNKFDLNEDELQGIHVLHPNRNEDKGRERIISKVRSSGKGRVDKTSVRPSTTKPQEITVLTNDLFDEIADHHSNISISIFMPTHRASQEGNSQDLNSFKLIVQKVISDLKAKGKNDNQINAVIKPAHDLIRNESFWDKTTNGLALFLSKGDFKFIRLPYTPVEKVFINEMYYLGPIVPLVNNKDKFYLLVISKKQAKLFRGDRFGLTDMKIKEMPNGISDVVHLEEKDDKNLFRTGSSGAGQGANYHGMGAGVPDEKENIALYLKEVDRTIMQEVLARENAPLVLAGVDYELSIFASVSQYNNIWPQHLKGSVENESLENLYQASMEVVAPHFDERTKRALEQFGNQSATTLVSTDARTIIPAAYYARVSQLFIQENEQIWGRFDEETGAVTIHDAEGDEDHDLLDRAIVKVFANGGEVHKLPKERMPNGAIMAALMRYEI